MHWFKYYPRILCIKEFLQYNNIEIEILVYPYIHIYPYNPGKIRTGIMICSIGYNKCMQINRVKTIFPAKPFSLYQRDKIIRMNNVLKYEVL